MMVDGRCQPGDFWLTGSQLFSMMEGDQESLAGQQVNYKGIADDAEIDQATAKNWLHILEAQGIVFLLRPYSNNVLKRTVSTPELYFYDTGLVCYLTRWSSPETAMNGALLEQDGKLFPIENKKMASPPKKLTKVFELIGKFPLERGTGAVYF